MTAITNEMVSDFDDAFAMANIEATRAGVTGWRRQEAAIRAGLEAVAPHIAAAQMAADAAAVRAEANDLKTSNCQPGYVAGFEDAAEALEEAADEAAKMLAERSTR